MMKTTLLLLTLISTTYSLITPRTTFLRSSNLPAEANVDSSKLIEDASTGWAAVWGYDGAMSDTYSSHFVIGNWLKSHKCGEGLKEDCPNELLNPGSVPAEVDVMAFLGVKRADPVQVSDSMKKA
eukprot:CAMPEP_0118633952 /NCGR_PEP_ID=MMETSP0785-20121206/1276_1 /TAXON_ID=91992 /ORGANISM="Bolidomonas pacifica, Strain CCMP 1866" /LENGTH=124 /DNA_ID=CAMNT_0006524871 /DNA_START=35 /DNA_END=409 /DNA_ORIENTATION=+